MVVGYDSYMIIVGYYDIIIVIHVDGRPYSSFILASGRSAFGVSLSRIIFMTS